MRNYCARGVIEKVRGINKKLSVSENIVKVRRYLYYLIKCLFLIKKPLRFIYHYVSTTLPRENSIELRTGLKILLSDNPVDVITVFVIFVKEDYGKLQNNHNIVIDIGANIGVFSLYAAQNGAKKIYAYEPNRSAFDVLLRNIAANKLDDVIVPHRLAVTDSDEKTVKISLCSSPYNEILRKTTNEDFEEVSTITLESILNQNKIDIVDLLKMDCEGSEYEIIFDLKRSVFLRIKEIRMEYHPGPVEKILSCFKQHNFRIVHFKRDGAILWIARSLPQF